MHKYPGYLPSQLCAFPVHFLSIRQSEAYLTSPSNNNLLDSMPIPIQTPGSHRATKLVSPAKGDPGRDDVD
jgi:hypothetical protein